MICTVSQFSGWPAAHQRQTRQVRPAIISTRCPTCQNGTAEPTFSMTPAGSWPGVTTSSWPGRLPSIRCTSERQTPHACTRTRTSCGSGSGAGTSRTSRLLLTWSNRAARMSDRRQFPGVRFLGCWRRVRRQLLVVVLQVESLEPPGELEGEIGPDGAVAAELVEVPAAAAAGQPHRRHELALQLLVERLLHVRAYAEGGDAALLHQLQCLEDVGELRLDHVDERGVTDAGVRPGQHEQIRETGERRAVVAAHAAAVPHLAQCPAITPGDV